MALIRSRAVAGTVSTKDHQGQGRFRTAMDHARHHRAPLSWGRWNWSQDWQANSFMMLQGAKVDHDGMKYSRRIEQHDFVRTTGSGRDGRQPPRSISHGLPPEEKPV